MLGIVAGARKTRGLVSITALARILPNCFQNKKPMKIIVNETAYNWIESDAIITFRRMFYVEIPVNKGR